MMVAARAVTLTEQRGRPPIMNASQAVDQGAESQDDIGRHDKPKGVRGDIFDLKASAGDAYDREEQRDQESEMVGLLGSKEPTASGPVSRWHLDPSSLESSVAARKTLPQHKRSHRFPEGTISLSRR
jgi:hypothetical protein